MSLKNFSIALLCGFFVFSQKEDSMGYYGKVFFRLIFDLFSIYFLVSLGMSIFVGFTVWQDLIVSALIFSIFMSLFFTFLQMNSIDKYKDWQFEGSILGGQYCRSVVSSIKPEELLNLLITDGKGKFRLREKTEQSLTFLSKVNWSIMRLITTISWVEHEEGYYTYRITCRPHFFMNFVDFGLCLNHIDYIFNKLVLQNLDRVHQES